MAKLNTEKRVPKGEIKYKFPLTEEQKEVKEAIFNNPITIVTGKSGSGKSAVCAQTALDLLHKREVEHILVTRPLVVVGKELGFLPGDIDDKLNPYLEAFVDNLIDCYDKEKIEQYLKQGQIKGMPIGFIRGKTLRNAVMVIEEAQNLTPWEAQALVERIDPHSKIIVNGDLAQTDINLSYTGLEYLTNMSNRIDGINHFKLKQNHRHPIVEQMIEYWYEFKKKNTHGDK